MKMIEDKLRALGATTPEQRTARFVAVLCLAFPDGAHECWRGEVEGHLVWPPRGPNGFGYDPMFVPREQPAGRSRTFGEYESHEKHASPIAPAPSPPLPTRGSDERPVVSDGGAKREPGFGVYVHWPFCAAKCPYCDFNSHVRHQPPDQARFAAAFAREIATTAERAPGRTVTSIFLGGGTPSLMEPATVGAILDAVAKHWTVAPDAEVTMEANPSSVEAERFRGYRAAGVNRVSLGVQALNDPDLKFLGRLHDVAAALARDRDRARDLPAPFVRSHLRPAEPDAGGLARRADARHRARRRSSLALPADHRAGDAVLTRSARPAS